MTDTSASSTVSVVIPTHDRASILQRTLESLHTLHRPPGVDVEVIVVANACRDETPQVVARFASEFRGSVRLIEEPRANLNVARNRGVVAATAAWIAFLDDDVRLDPDWLGGLVDVLSEHSPDIVGGRVLLDWSDVARPAWLDASLEGFLTRKDHGRQVIPLTDRCDVVGANFAVRRALFERVGLFVEGLDRTGSRLLSAGDNEFVERALVHGARAYYSPRMLVHHWVAPHRATPEYIGRVARANAESRVYIKRGLTHLRVLRTIVGHLYLLVWYGLGELALRRNEQARWVHCYVRRMTGWGGLVGAWNWLLGRRPLAAAPPSLPKGTSPAEVGAAAESSAATSLGTQQTPRGSSSPSLLNGSSAARSADRPTANGS